MTETVFVPFPKRLYDDLIRFSDGRCDPAEWAVVSLERWIDRNFETEMSGLGWANDDFMRMFSDRMEDFAEAFYPAVLDYWAAQDGLADKKPKGRPLVWKGIVIEAGSDVRMSYGGEQHYAKVEDGKIVDADGAFTPSEWASKVASGTSRSAWRDLWFRAPRETTWNPATVLRQKFLESLDFSL